MSSNEAVHGAVMVAELSTIELESAVISQNSASIIGQLRLYRETKLTATESSFLRNRATLGTITLSFGCEAVIEECLFYRNFVQTNGSGLYIESSSADVINSIFDQNSASYGAAIYATDLSIVTFHNSICRLNSAVGGCFHGEVRSAFDITNTSMEDNKSIRDGSVVFLGTHSFANITDSILKANSATQNGGIASVENSDLHIYNTKLNRNTAGERGGNIFCKDGSRLLVNNVTFSDGTAKFGGSVLLEESQGNFTDVIFKNNTLSSLEALLIWRKAKLCS